MTKYVWSWGDNSESVTMGYKNQSHTYSKPGLYTISVMVTEDNETFRELKSIKVLGNKRILKTICML